MISGTSLIGNVMVQTTDHRGPTPEELAERALAKVLYVGKDSHPAIRDQAEAFKENIREVMVFYMKEAVASERVTLAVKLRDAGFPELVKLLD
jgi:hypothetical protein